VALRERLLQLLWHQRPVTPAEPRRSGDVLPARESCFCEGADRAVIGGSPLLIGVGTAGGLRADRQLQGHGGIVKLSMMFGDLLAEGPNGVLLHLFRRHLAGRYQGKVGFHDAGEKFLLVLRKRYGRAGEDDEDRKWDD